MTVWREFMDTSLSLGMTKLGFCFEFVDCHEICYANSRNDGIFVWIYLLLRKMPAHTQRIARRKPKQKPPPQGGEGFFTLFNFSFEKFKPKAKFTPKNSIHLITLERWLLIKGV